MEGEEIFGSYKWKKNLAPRLKGDSRRHNCVNFSHPHVNHTIVRSSVHIEQPRADQIQEMLKSLKLHVEMEFGIWK